MADRHAFAMWIGHFYTQKCCFHALDVWCKWSFMCFFRLLCETESDWIWIRKKGQRPTHKIHTFILGAAKKREKEKIPNHVFIYELDTYNESNIYIRVGGDVGQFSVVHSLYLCLCFFSLVSFLSCTQLMRVFFFSISLYSLAFLFRCVLVFFDEENRFGLKKIVFVRSLGFCFFFYFAAPVVHL